MVVGVDVAAGILYFSVGNLIIRPVTNGLAVLVAVYTTGAVKPVNGTSEQPPWEPWPPREADRLTRASRCFESLRKVTGDTTRATMGISDPEAITTAQTSLAAQTTGHIGGLGGLRVERSHAGNDRAGTGG